MRGSLPKTAVCAQNRPPPVSEWLLFPKEPTLKIAVLGASVSAQNINHTTKEPTGYVEVLRREHMPRLGASEIPQITYPGSRASDGGLLRVRDVVAYAPDICIFEPLIEDGSRGVRISPEEILYIYSQLTNAGILPFTVMLPNPANRSVKQWQEYNKYKQACNRFNLPVLEIDISTTTALEEKFKDVHTLLPGAQIYARQIADALTALGDPKARLAQVQPITIGPDQHIYVQHLPHNPAPGSVTKIQLELLFEQATEAQFRLVQQQSIGPFSPLLDVMLSGNTPPQGGDGQQISKSQTSVWDPYCHYARTSYVSLCNLSNGGHKAVDLHLEVSTQDPDYSKCRRDDVQWPAAAARTLRPLGPLVLISNRPVGVSVKTLC